MTASDHLLRILQVSASDLAGGAERSAANLHRAFRALGNESWLAVGSKRTDDPDVLAIPNDRHRNAWVGWWTNFAAGNAHQIGRLRGMGRVTSLCRRLGEPRRWIDEQFGIEDFSYPGTAGLLELTPSKPDILHCHNLHGGYFDLRELPRLSQRIPTILNLRDAWLLSGHCAFSFECDRWKRGCGRCPDLTLYPATRRDATAYNWERKRQIFAMSRLYVTTPSQWLMDKVNESILVPAIVERRVIPNGVDTTVFSPGDKAAARMDLGIADSACVLMFAANGIRTNVWKDYDGLLEALRIVGRESNLSNLLLLAVGESAPPERIGRTVIRFVPFQSDASALAKLYRAADIYVHVARIESFGNVLLEARACGTPAIATAVGGIPEHVRALDCNYSAASVRTCGRAEATGILTAPGDSGALAGGILLLLENRELLRALGTNCVQDVDKRFRLSIQAQRFLAWYREILCT